MQQIDLIDESCGFCTEIHDIPAENNLLDNYIRLQLGLDSRVIFQTDHFVVIPTIGSFVEGYVMVVSKDHYTCVGNIPESHFSELKALLLETKNRIRSAYGMDTVCFEHGSVSCTNRFGGCINHAHIHIVPSRESLIGYLPEYGLEYQELAAIDALQPFGRDGIPYLYFEDVDEQQYVATGEFVVSQFFRKLLAHSHGVPEQWDWRSNLNLDQMRKTIQTLGCCEKNQMGGSL